MRGSEQGRRRGRRPRRRRMRDELRTQGFEGQVTLITAEDEDPYDRPPLSKAFLTADSAPEVRLPYDTSEATVVYACRAAELTRHGVNTDRGEIPADAVIVATGPEPIRLPGSGPRHVLRTRADAVAVRSALAAKPPVVIIGASSIGAEVSTAAINLGCPVICVEAGAAPLHQAVGADLGARTTPWWSGVDLRLSQQVASIDDVGVTLSCGTVIEADLALTAVGVSPAVSWLAGSDVPVDRGVLVDHRMIADVSSDHPWHDRLAAVGDAAAWMSHRYCTRLRVRALGRRPARTEDGSDGHPGRARRMPRSRPLLLVSAARAPNAVSRAP
jgi:NADPH-dependent 2,4-dienoyl-CoA reductase/sulfur reductase-like enzyme